MLYSKRCNHVDPVGCYAVMPDVMPTKFMVPMFDFMERAPLEVLSWTFWT